MHLFRSGSFQPWQSPILLQTLETELPQPGATRMVKAAPNKPTKQVRVRFTGSPPAKTFTANSHRKASRLGRRNAASVIHGLTTGSFHSWKPSPSGLFAYV